MKRFLTAVAGILLLGGLFSTSVSAQGGYLVKGVVVDAFGPVYGATVMEAGTTNGVSTGLDGDFILTVSSAAAPVEVSCIGYATQSFAAGEMPSEIVLKEDIEFLEATVVIGYGSQTKKEVTGSVASLKPDDFNQGSVANPMGLLQGKVAGLNVIKNGGDDPAQNSMPHIGITRVWISRMGFNYHGVGNRRGHTFKIGRAHV